MMLVDKIFAHDVELKAEALPADRHGKTGESLTDEQSGTAFIFSLPLI